MMMDNLDNLLSGWDGKPTEAPSFVREENYDGNWEAIWFWVADHEGEVVIDGATQVVFHEPEGTITWTYVEDMLSYDKMSGDPHSDEDGNPFWTEYGQCYNEESIEFDRKEVLTFLRDYLSGRLEKQTTTHDYGYGPHHTYHWFDKPGTPAGRARIPRSREELARWINSMAWEAVHAHGGGEWVESAIADELEIDVHAKKGEQPGQ